MEKNAAVSQKPKVLIVDDRVENLLALGVALKNLDCEVVEAASGQEAISYLSSNKVAAVILDVQMPGLDGFSVSKMIRDNTITAVTPIILVSAFEITSDYVKKAYQSGATALLMKPLDLDVLEGKVGYFLQLFKKIESNEQKNIEARIFAENETVQLIENSLDAVIGAGADEKILYWNAQAEITFGWSKSEVLGQVMAELIIPERFRSAHRRGMNHFILTGQTTIQNKRIEVPALRKSGEEFPVELTVTSVKKPDGSYRFYSFISDISERVQARKAIEEIKNLSQRFNRSAKAIDLGVWYCDLPLDIVQMSSETRHHLFLPQSGEIRISDFYAHIHPDDLERTRRAVEEATEAQRPYDITYKTIDPKNPGAPKFIRAAGWTDYDSSGKPTRFDGITLDVTAIVHANKELEAAKEMAEKANSLKSFFLASMSHEIRTPLGAILGFAELARDSKISASERNNYLDVILRNGEGLSVIINDILDLSKVESGRMGLEFAECSVENLIAEILSLMNVKAKPKNITLDSVIDPQVVEKVVTDSLRARQVLLNLVGNAIKFTPRGLVRISVSKTLEGSNRFIHFDVSDSGIGISKSDAERIFEAFAQAEESTTRRFGGTGLGLALSRRLANALGGDVTLVQSEEGKGSTFRFTLKDYANPLKTSHSLLRKAAMPELPANALSGVRVLVVDDSQDNQFLIWQYLKKFGATMESAENGLVGQKMATGGNYDIVLMDIQMPEMDGYTATEHLRSLGYEKPIVALTAHAMSEVRNKCFQVGCTTHLTKPINSKELIETIYNLTKGSHPENSYQKN